MEREIDDAMRKIKFADWIAASRRQSENVFDYVWRGAQDIAVTRGADRKLNIFARETFVKNTFLLLVRILRTSVFS